MVESIQWLFAHALLLGSFLFPASIGFLITEKLRHDKNKLAVPAGLITFAVLYIPVNASLDHIPAVSEKIEQLTSR
jgi:hypothetical protein